MLKNMVQELDMKLSEMVERLEKIENVIANVSDT